MTARIPAKYTVFPVLLTAAALAALFAPLPGWQRAILALLYFAGLGGIIGDALMPEEKSSWSRFFGFLGLASAVIALGSVIYLVYRLDAAATAALLVMAATGAAALARRTLRRRSPFGTMREAAPASPSKEGRGILVTALRGAAGLAAAASALLLVSYGFATLAAAATDGSIRSPWDVVPRMFFVIFFLAALAAAAAARGDLAPRLALAPSAALLALASSVAAIVYKVGFGFDPFIHRATEQVIVAQGMISPKPLYYLGQYVAVTLVARLTGAPVARIDSALVPVTLAFVVPCAYYALRKTFGFSRGSCAAAASLFLLFPLSAFAATTPQGFADAVFVLAALCALPAAAGAFPRPLVVALAAATAAIHPLAGIPLLMFVALLLYLSFFERTSGAREFGRRLVLLEMAVIGALALPVVFVLNSWISGSGVAIDLEALKAPGAAIEALSSPPVSSRRFMAIYDFVYSWKAARSAAILLAAAAGAWLARRRTKAGPAFLIGALMLAADYALMRAVVRFPFLIAYERSDYADRVFELLLFLLAPLALAAAAAAFERMRGAGGAVRIGAMVLAAALAASSLYLAYPRRDKYESSRGWSTSGADVDAVRLIDKDAAGAPYVVLANQSTSAAAVGELGFKRYFASKDPSTPAPVFFYPIPTGGPLYARFLDMNSSLGAADAARKAMDLAGTDMAYYVVTYYWWDASRIILAAQKEADRWWSVGDKDFVFKYARKH